MILGAVNSFEELLTNLGPVKVVFYAFLLLFAIIGTIYLNKRNRLDQLKSKKVGDGQHGTDKFLNLKEMEKLYKTIKIPNEMTDMSSEWLPGRILHFNPQTREAIIDTSYTHAAVEAPTETGKTTTYVVPNAQYNLMAGTSMVIPCIKPELIDLLAQDAKELGYEVGIIDFNKPAKSIGFDFFADINEYIDKYKEDPTDLMAKAEAESLAGQLAKDIVTSRDRSNSENSFFLGSSEGLVHATVLLTSLYGTASQKHLSSVRSLVQNIMMMSPEENEGRGNTFTSKIQRLIGHMPEDFGPRKHVGAAFASNQETEANIYSSVLNDLKPINNSQAEQIVSVPGKKDCFQFMDLINKKYVLFIHMPETKPEFYIFAKLIIKKICMQLSNYANTECKGVLPKPVKIIWDEFGLSPKIDKFDEEMAIDRGKHILFDLIYQDTSQLVKIYGEEDKDVILHQCASEIILGISPTNVDRAEELSKAIGKNTILSGSVTRSHNTGRGGTGDSITHQMMERELMTVGEILRMEKKNQRLVFRRGEYPFLANFPSYYKEEWGLTPKPYMEENSDPQYYGVDYLSFDHVIEVLDENKDMTVTTHTGVITNFSPATKSTGDDALAELAMKLYELSNNDEHVKQLCLEKQWPKIMNAMKPYYNKITKMELQALMIGYQERIERS
ncbi:type IV secretion system protein VirD4 [Breznakia blatticola]|uniref:Type IV secretion system protein VirD4 n=1 Tax=Breznakia blatticola TaxID=1754012 RepID=A0A4R7Z9Q7_9FIRM|nr:type IV secretory system conjugative DNA transfer family protein [Breznakia blatticola]TDW13105.1 type IV secretion system protein VirD4 [Breznakia blatticola]